MTPPEGCDRCREQIGAFLLGKLDGGELEAVRTHLDSCPACRAEVRELEPVVAALAQADPDRVSGYPQPPGDLEESTLAPILGEIQRTPRYRRSFRWSAVAAAAIFVVVISLAGLSWLVQPAVAMEPLSFSVAPGVEVKGYLIARASGTQIKLVVSGLRDYRTYGVTLVSEDKEQVNAGTFVGAEDEPVRGTFNAALSREDAAKLEVRTPGGEPAFIAELPEEPRAKVRDWPLVGVLPWAGPDLQNDTIKPGGPEGPDAEDKSPAGLPERPEAGGFGGGAPENGSPPPSDGEGLPPGNEKPEVKPEESEPGRDPSPSSPSPSSPSQSSPSPSSPPGSCEELPPDERPPTCGEY